MKLSDDLLSLIDERAARRGQSRAELIEEAVAAYVKSDRDAQISREIVAGYTRWPDDEFDYDEAAKRLIAEEPW